MTRDAATPNPKEVNPRRVFERLFQRGRPGETEAAAVEGEAAFVASERALHPGPRSQRRIQLVAARES